MLCFEFGWLICILMYVPILVYCVVYCSEYSVVHCNVVKSVALRCVAFCFVYLFPFPCSLFFVFVSFRFVLLCFVVLLYYASYAMLYHVALHIIT